VRLLKDVTFEPLNLLNETVEDLYLVYDGDSLFMHFVESSINSNPSASSSNANFILQQCTKKLRKFLTSLANKGVTFQIVFFEVHKVIWKDSTFTLLLREILKYHLKEIITDFLEFHDWWSAPWRDFVKDSGPMVLFLHTNFHLVLDSFLIDSMRYPTLIRCASLKGFDHQKKRTLVAPVSTEDLSGQTGDFIPMCISYFTGISLRLDHRTKTWVHPSSIQKVVKSVERMILSGSSDALDIHVFKEVSHSATPLFVAACAEVIKRNISKNSPHVVATLVLLGRLVVLSSYIQQLAFPPYTNYWENLTREEKMLLNHPLIDFLPQFIHQFQTAMYGIVQTQMIPIKCEIDFLDTNVLYITTFQLLRTFQSSKWITFEECINKLIPKAFYSRFDTLSRYLSKQIPEEVVYQISSYSDEILRGTVKVNLAGGSGDDEYDIGDVDSHAWALVVPGDLVSKSSLNIIGFGICACAAVITILVLVIVLVIVPQVRNSENNNSDNSTTTSNTSDVTAIVTGLTTAIITAATTGSTTGAPTNSTG